MSTPKQKPKHLIPPEKRGKSLSFGQADTREMVNHPSHYQMGGIEVIDYIADVCGVEGCYAFDIGNALKYISRAGRKFNVKEDLQKAVWYLNHAISCVEKMQAEEGEKTMT